MILMNDFKKEYEYFEPQVTKILRWVLASGYYILSKNVEEFEKEFAKYIGAKYCVGVGNGLEALQIALMSIDVKQGDEVITVSNTAVATALAISNIGAKPVFVDIDEYYHMDVSKIEEKITKKTKAIIPVHLFGQIVDIDNILKIAKKHNLKVIEDACQAHGASLDGKKAGSFGSLGCFSFYPTKNLGAYGDAGAITTDSKTLYQKCLMLRNYGQKNRYEHHLKGMNSRLDELQAAILNTKLKKLNSLLSKRNKIAQTYIFNLKGVNQIILPKIRKNNYHSFHLFVILAENRDKLQKYLKEKGTETIIHYPIPIHKQVSFKEYANVKLPVTEKLSKEILSLPINPFLEEREVIEICSAIKHFYQNEE